MLFHWKNTENKPIIIYFYAEWSGISILTLPKLEALSLQYKDVIFKTVNVDDAEDFITYMDVENVPTTIFINKRGDLITKLEENDETRLEKKIKIFCKAI